MQKTRINITLNQTVHEKAKYWASREEISLSAIIEQRLQQYCKEKESPKLNQSNEPLVGYYQSAEMKNLISAAIKLPSSKLFELTQFAEFLGQKSFPSNELSLKGILTDKIWMSDDFDEPINDFKEYMP